MLRIWPIEVLDDNFVWVLERDGCDRVAVVDPGLGEPVVAAANLRSLSVDAVLVSHHHRDHVGGLPVLIREFHPEVYGAADDGVPGVVHSVGEGDTIALPFLDLELEVWSLPGHTANHLGFIGGGVAFVGDTLFAGGCGRVLGGTFEQLYASLERLRALPPETKIYCAHEYTVANLRFATTVERGNERIKERLASAVAARDLGQPTVPSTLGYELETNIFLRCAEASVSRAAAKRAGRGLPSGAEIFEVVRSWKDDWSG